ncbi:MAG: phage tail protein [Dehalococcoidales bacterium]|nr:phage tail protein [Dehalococcoidales bacterium]
MATINPSQDYDIIHTLTLNTDTGNCAIRVHRGSSLAISGTVYYRAGTSGEWTELSVASTTTTFPISSTTMQVGHDWNKSGDAYMTAAFQGETKVTGIGISQKAVLSGVIGNYFICDYARDCPNLTSLDVPDISNTTSVGDYFMRGYAYDCSSLTILDIPDTNNLTSVGDYFMRGYAYDCSSIVSLMLPLAGWFASNNVDWSVPSGRLGYLKGYVFDSGNLDDWQSLVVSGETLYTNYIQDSDDVLVSTTDKVTTPTTLSLTITTYAPTLKVAITPATAELIITGYAPTATNERIVTPPTLSLSITTYAPTVSYTTSSILALTIATISSTQTDFPIDVDSVNYPILNRLFAVLGDDWQYLQIRDSNGNICYTEVVEWDSANERMELCFKAPSMSSGNIFYFGRSDDVNSYIGLTGSTPAKAVWDSNYVFVSHMNDNGDSTGILDSTSNANNGTKGAGDAAPTETDGLVGKAQSFSRANAQYILAGNSIVDESFTATVIFKSDNNSLTQGLISEDNGTLRDWFLRTLEPNQIQTGIWQSSGSLKTDLSGVNTSPNDVWNIATIKYDKASSLLYSIANSSSLTTGTDGTFRDMGSGLYIGRHASASESFNGLISEIRISNTARSEDWISLTNSNLKDHDLFTIDVVNPDIELTPTTLSLSITTYIPSLVYGYVYTPTTLALAITGYAPTITIQEPPPPALKYTLEIRDSSGNLLAILENAYDRVYTQRVNEPQSLTFSIPAEDDKVSGLAKPNQIWLRDYSTGTLIKKFVITRLVKKDSGNCTYQVECKGYLSKLLKAVVQSYSPSGKTPTEILTALLAYQTLDTITLGTVDITGTYSFSWSNTTVLACLNDCLNVWGGYFDVDNDNELTWLDDIGSDVGQQIRYKKNLIDVEEETDYEGQNGRLYPSGSGGIVLSDKSVVMEVADQSEDATYGYLTVPTDYICFKESTLEILRKGTKEDLAAFDVIDNVSPGSDWTVGSGVAYWDSIHDGNDSSSKLGHRWNVAKWVSGLDIRVAVIYNYGTSDTIINRIVVEYTTDAFTTTTTIYDSGVTLSLGDGTHDLELGFEQRVNANGLAVKIYTYTPLGGNVANNIRTYDANTLGTIEFFDESESWTNINDQQLKIAIASYESGDTYYLSYDLADYLKDLTAISTYGDEGIQMSFSYAADVDTLLAYAIAQLELINDPPKSYSGNVLYLDEIDSNFSFDELDLGNIVDLIHEPLGIDSSVRVVGMSKNLDNPLTGSIEIVRKAKSLTEAFKAIYGRL